MESTKVTNQSSHREDHWVYLDRTWAQLLGVKRSAGIYRIRGRELRTRLARKSAKPDSSGVRTS